MKRSSITSRTYHQKVVGVVDTIISVAWIGQYPIGIVLAETRGGEPAGILAKRYSNRSRVLITPRVHRYIDAHGGPLGEASMVNSDCLSYSYALLHRCHMPPTPSSGTR